MDTLLIILVLGAVAIGVVVWIARRPSRPRSPDQQMDQDTAWNDPITPAETHPDRKPEP